MNKRWDWLDYVLVFVIPIGTMVVLCYNPFKEGRSMQTEIIAALITGAFVLAGILLKHFLYDRKQYKDILTRLGRFEDMSLEKQIKAQLGKTEEYGSLTLQHTNIKKQINDKHKLLSDKIGDTSKGTITSQTQEILAMVKQADERAKLEQAKAGALSPEQMQLKAVTDSVAFMAAQWAELLTQNAALKAENERLRGELTAEKQRPVVRKGQTDPDR